MNASGKTEEEGRKVSVKAVAKYALLPGIFPRFGRLADAVNHILFTFTTILVIAGLIDRQHPCAQPENIGRYRFSHVLLMAWHDLRFTRENISKILMFVAVVLTIVLLWGLLIALAVKAFFFAGTAAAQSREYFDAKGAESVGFDYKVNQDWVLLFLERIFGNTGPVDFWTNDPQGAHNAIFTGLFTGLIGAYSKALFALAAFMIIYLLVITLADAAKTGKPFGKRFDSVWAPIRMAIALFLLMPIAGTNYNAAHLAVFQVSEWGNSLANNLWLRTIAYMGTAEDNVAPEGRRDQANFVALASIDPGYKFVRDVFLIQLCMKGYNLLSCQSSDEKSDIVSMTIGRSDTSIIYQFGVPDSNDYCGSIEVPMLYSVPDGAPGGKPDDPSGGGGGSIDAMDYLPNKIIDGYTAAIESIIDPTSEMGLVSDKMVAAYVDDKDANFFDIADAQMIAQWIKNYQRIVFGYGNTDKPFGAYASQLNLYNQWIVRILERDAKYGWGTAGVFYLRMSNAMAMVQKVVEQMPRIKTYPVNLTRMYANPADPTLSNKEGKWRCKLEDLLGDPGFCETKSGPQLLFGLLDKGNAWFKEAPMRMSEIYEELGSQEYSDSMRIAQKERAEDNVDTKTSFRAVSATLNKMMRIDDADLHPLGTVVGWGQAFLTGAFVAYNIAIATSLASAIVKILSAGLINFFSPLAMMATSVGHMLFVPGFVLAFVLPMLPFIYFLFAVMEWVASIVEAVIGAPLWALSFIALQGDLMTKTSLTGVKRFLEILLRPLFIILGLITSVLVFSAAVSFVNAAYALFLNAYDAANGDRMGYISSLAAGVASALIYAFVMYSLALSCFKLIDVIPDRFARWLDLPRGFNSSIRIGTAQIRDELVGAVLIKKIFDMIKSK